MAQVISRKDEISGYYEKHVLPSMEDLKGNADSPDVVLQLKVAGKAVTKSEIKGFTDCIQCYDYILNQELKAKNAGATAPAMIVAEPVVFYIPFKANVKLFENFVGMTIFSHVSLMLLSETKGKKQGYLSFDLKAARMDTLPIKFGNVCYAVSMTYEDFEVNHKEIDPETGDNNGTIEGPGINFTSGEKR